MLAAVAPVRTVVATAAPSAPAAAATASAASAIDPATAAGKARQQQQQRNKRLSPPPLLASSPRPSTSCRDPSPQPRGYPRWRLPRRRRLAKIAQKRAKPAQPLANPSRNLADLAQQLSENAERYAEVKGCGIASRSTRAGHLEPNQIRSPLVPPLHLPAPVPPRNTSLLWRASATDR